MRKNRLWEFLAGATLLVTSLILVSGSAAAQQEAILHSFNIAGPDGAFPTKGLIADPSGNLYGATGGGGISGAGISFRLFPRTDGSWKEQIIHEFFTQGVDGDRPDGYQIFDAAGNLYGTTYYGGPYDMGTAYELMPQPDGSWKEKELHIFGSSPTDGTAPSCNLFSTIPAISLAPPSLGGFTVSERFLS